MVFAVLLIGAYLLNGWLISRGWHPFIHGGAPGGWRPYIGECSVAGVTLPVPCWIAVTGPAVLLMLGSGLFRDTD